MPPTRRAPQDHLAAAGSTGLPPFTWTSSAGIVVTLPNARILKAGDFRKARHMAPVDFTFYAFETAVRRDLEARVAADPDDRVPVSAEHVDAALEALDRIDVAELDTLSEAWLSASTGATPGESDTSSS